MVQESGFIRGVNPKSKIQNPQESGFIRGGESKIQNPKSKIQNRMTPLMVNWVRTSLIVMCQIITLKSASS
jgi:hypothetical protein